MLEKRIKEISDCYYIDPIDSNGGLWISVIGLEFYFESGVTDDEIIDEITTRVNEWRTNRKLSH